MELKKLEKPVFIRKMETCTFLGFAVLLILGLSACDPAAQDDTTNPDEDFISGTWRAHDTIHDPFSGEYILITTNTIRPDSTYKLSVHMKIKEEINSLYSESGDWKIQDHSLIFTPTECYISDIATGSLTILPPSECSDRIVNPPKNEVWPTKDQDSEDIVFYKE